MSHADPVSFVILWVTLIFFFGVSGRYIAQRFGQPGVLGELLMGVIVGNVCYFSGMQLAVVLREGPVLFNITHGIFSNLPLKEAITQTIASKHYAAQVFAALTGHHGMEFFKVAYVVDSLSRYGVIFLIFMVGLESSLDEIKHTGKQAVWVAVIGVVAPIILGLCVTSLLIPDASFKVDLFVAATLSATSVGISARVFKDLHKLQTREAHIVLGASMVDDILGLLILAIVSSLVTNEAISFISVGKIILFAMSFFVVALYMGPKILRRAIHFFSFLEPAESKLLIAFLFVMGLSWLATTVQLAAIIGAFTAGIILHDEMFECGKKHELSIQTLISPLEFILAPLFFMLIGIQVKIESFLDWHVLFMALALIIAASIGKLISGFGGGAGVSRLLIGLGMLPRGEVGLVFAALGKTLDIFSEQLFAAIVLMVLVTTFLAPLLLKCVYARKIA